MNLLHGRDVHLDLRALRRHTGHLKIPELGRALGGASGKEPPQPRNE
jgi:hypothetical protein